MLMDIKTDELTLLRHSQYAERVDCIHHYQCYNERRSRDSRAANRLRG